MKDYRLLQREAADLRAKAGELAAKQHHSPDDIGSAVFFLASDEARYISGTSITVDGGYSASCP